MRAALKGAGKADDLLDHLDYLDRVGVLNRTLLITFSDHGARFANLLRLGSTL